MITRVYCDQSSFHAVEFHPGMNVILAERTKESKEKDSRNGLGKTTLIQIIHFCLGANTSPNKGLRVKDLENWTFSLDLEIAGVVCSISRNTSNLSKLYIDGDFSNWPIAPLEDSQGRNYYKTKQWRSILGWLIFQIPVNLTGLYSPTFRSSISYFIRRGKDAFTSPFEYNRKQREFNKQVSNAFLLGLDWEFAQKIQTLKDQEKSLKELKKISKSGIIQGFMGSLGELESTKIRIETELDEMKKQIDSFRVHPQYKQIQSQANKLTVEIHNRINENIKKHNLLVYYQDVIKNEKPATENQVLDIYREAQFTFPEKVIRHLEDVQDFHAKIVADRKSFLEVEVKKIELQILKTEEKIQALTNERADLLTILETHGALEEYSRLNEQLAKKRQEFEEIDKNIQNLELFNKETSTIKIEKEKVLQEARIDYNERKDTRKRAIELFNANSKALYQTPGKLIIDVRDTGYRFEVEIERARSDGISQMKVFCYDLMLAQLWGEQDGGPGVLIHDSNIFDGVDERQVANALELAEKEAKRLNFRYVCCLNSDQLPTRDFSLGFDIREKVRLILTDKDPEGSLLGIRF